MWVVVWSNEWDSFSSHVDTQLNALKKILN